MAANSAIKNHCQRLYFHNHVCAMNALARMINIKHLKISTKYSVQMYRFYVTV